MESAKPGNTPTVVYLSHGGGPFPLLGDEAHSELVENLKTISASIKKPSAILVVSAHWEEDVPAITAGVKPGLIYDYYGFPDESYDIQYPAPGNPDLAKAVASRLIEKGITAQLDKNRGFDHGLFVPLKIMYPEADIPCVQLSVVNDLDPTKHIEIGEALTGLEYDNLLIIGSGFSFHNMKAFFSPSTHETRTKNESFEAWLIDTCSNTNVNENERRRLFEYWEQAPYARYCHPREEHLLPLHVCYGIAQRACSRFFELTIIGKKASAYLWC